MTKTNAEVTPQPAQGEQAQDTQSPQGLAAQVANALAKTQDGSGSAQGKVETPDEITVDWGGTPRKVKTADLVAAAQRAEEVGQMEKALDRKLKTVANREQFEALQATIDGMTPTQRGRLMQVLQNPQMLDGEDDDASELDQAVAAATGKTTSSGRPDETQQQLAMLTKAVQALASKALTDQQRERTMTLQQQIDAAMKQYPVFDTEPAAAKFMRSSIAAMHAANPEIGLDKIVAEAAKASQRLADGAASGVIPDASASPSFSLPKREFKGADLASGGIREAVLAALAGNGSARAR